ncbi:MAG TPA: phosphoribosyl-AMP cyclohydrolase, partial [Candidatus Limnocylindrales bacterium]
MPAARPGPVELAAGLDPAAADLAAVHWNAAGLVAGVVQDVADGRVLMLGWLDEEALAATLGTGEVHFHSRSRGRLWRKGESS